MLFLQWTVQSEDERPMRNEGRRYLSRLCGNCHWRVRFCLRERWRKRESKFVFCFREVVYTRSLTEGWAAHGTFSNCGKADLPCRPVHNTTLRELRANNGRRTYRVSSPPPRRHRCALLLPRSTRGFSSVAVAVLALPVRTSPPAYVRV